MYGRGHVFMGFRMDPNITKQKLKPGTVRRIAAYARPYRWYLAIFLLMTGIDALITVVNPLLLREIIDQVEARIGKVRAAGAEAPAARGNAAPQGNGIPRTAWQSVKK